MLALCILEKSPSRKWHMGSKWAACVVFLQFAWIQQGYHRILTVTIGFFTYPVVTPKKITWRNTFFLDLTIFRFEIYLTMTLWWHWVHRSEYHSNFKTLLSPNDLNNRAACCRKLKYPAVSPDKWLGLIWLLTTTEVTFLMFILKLKGMGLHKWSRHHQFPKKVL